MGKKMLQFFYLFITTTKGGKNMGEEWRAMSKKRGQNLCYIIDPFGLGFFGRRGWGIFCNWEPIFGKRRKINNKVLRIVEIEL